MISFSNFLSTSSTAQTEQVKNQTIHRDNERSNLLTISRLVLKCFLEKAMLDNNRIIEEDTQQLDDLLMMLEKVLWHGFKSPGQKSILSMRGPDSDLWSFLSLVSRGNSSMLETVTCVDQMEKLQTPITRIRAFLRIAVMQKKLADFFQRILEFSKLSDFYEPWALLLDDGVIHLIGALLGLSVVDCNLNLDFEYLQHRPPSLDLLTYIKLPTVGNELPEKVECSSDKEKRVLLDQNHYLEGRIRQLESNLDSLKKKIASVESETSGISLQNEMVTFRSTPDTSSKHAAGTNFEEENERLLSQLAEREDSLRIAGQQLEDTKKITAELYEKLRLSEEAVRRFEREIVEIRQSGAQERDSLKRTIVELESQNRSINDLIATKDSRDDSLRTELEKTCEKYTTTVGKLEGKQKELAKAEQELEKLRRRVEELTIQLNELPFLKEELGELREKYRETSQRAEEAEQALQELGGHLSESKLRMIDLAEELLPLSDAHWAQDSDVANCTGCEDKFTLSKRKHHCRMCGSIFCAACSEGRVKLPSNPKPARVCDQCFSVLKGRQTV